MVSNGPMSSPGQKISNPSDNFQIQNNQYGGQNNRNGIQNSQYSSQNNPNGIQNYPNGIQNSQYNSQNYPNGIQNYPNGIQNYPNGIQSNPSSSQSNPSSSQNNQYGSQNNPNGSQNNQYGSQNRPLNEQYLHSTISSNSPFNQMQNSSNQNTFGQPLNQNGQTQLNPNIPYSPQSQNNGANLKVQLYRKSIKTFLCISKLDKENKTQYDQLIQAVDTIDCPIMLDNLIEFLFESIKPNSTVNPDVLNKVRTFQGVKIDDFTNFFNKLKTPNVSQNNGSPITYSGQTQGSSLIMTHLQAYTEILNKGSISEIETAVEKLKTNSDSLPKEGPVGQRSSEQGQGNTNPVQSKSPQEQSTQNASLIGIAVKENKLLFTLNGKQIDEGQNS